MSRLRATLVLAALLSPMVVSGQAGADSDLPLWRFVYPNARALISIDWARIRQSPAGAMIREKWLTSGAMAAIPAVELLNDIDRVLISSPGKDSADDSAEPAILVAIQGHFDAARVRQVFTRLGAKPQSYNSFQVYRPQRRGQKREPEDSDARDTAWVLFDSETILYGDAPSVFAALDRNQFARASSQPTSQASPEPGSIAARAGVMAANYELWVLMDATEIMSSDQIAGLFQGGEWASEAQGFEAGVNLRAGLAADVTVRFPSDAIAKRVTAELTRVMNLAAKDKSSGAQLQDIAKKLKFNADGAATRISLRLTQPELEKTAQAFAASHKAAAQLAGNAHGSTGPVTNLTAAPNAALAPAKPAMIRIEGLDEGTREIPFEEGQH
jgi:hypothetical protein